MGETKVTLAYDFCLHVCYNDIRPEQHKITGDLAHAISKAELLYKRFSGVREVRVTSWLAVLEEGSEAPVMAIVNRYGTFGRMG